MPAQTANDFKPGDILLNESNQIVLIIRDIRKDCNLFMRFTGRSIDTEYNSKRQKPCIADCHTMYVKRILCNIKEPFYEVLLRNLALVSLNKSIIPNIFLE